MLIVSVDVRLWIPIEWTGEYRCCVFLATARRTCDNFVNVTRVAVSTSKLSPQLFGAHLASFSTNSRMKMKVMQVGQERRRKKSKAEEGSSRGNQIS
jgi:hypothetical protein